MAVDGDSYLGVDLGTSGIKLVLIGVDGNTLAESEASYPVLRPQPGWAEGDAESWWRAFIAAVGSMGPVLRQHPPRAMAVDGQMHGVVLCDEAGRPVRPAVLWPDRRADLSAWMSLPEPMRARLANPLVPGMYGPILAWLAEHEPEAIARAHVALLPKDVLRARMGGGIGTDRSDASATLLWDLPADRWAMDVTAHTGVPAALIPQVHESAQVVGNSSSLAELVPGYARDLPLAAGAGDTPAALLATGLNGATLINLGSGAQVLRVTDQPTSIANPASHTYADADSGWYRMAAVQNAGLAVQWVLQVFGSDWSHATSLSGRLDTHKTVSFIPFLTGERGGVAAPTSRGAWVGLDSSTSRDDMILAAVEAMLFTVRRGWELLGDDASGPVKLSGGGGRTSAIQQLLADLLQRPVQRLDIRSASATGAAMLAARAVGQELRVHHQASPDVHPRGSDALEARYQTWRKRCVAADL